MAKLNTGNIIQDLSCFLCNKYLSRSPIFVLPGSESVCENCSIAKSKVKPYKVAVLEVLLRDTFFPCDNKKYGCKETFKFDTGKDHEDKCMFQQIKCSFHSIIKCDWKDTVTEFKKHVTSQHPSFIQKTAEFEIDLTKDQNRTFLVLEESDLFLVSYKYDSRISHLAYIVASYNSYIKAQCRLQLTNISNTAYTLEVKGCESVHYFDGLLNAGIESFLNLCECKVFLDNAKCVRIKIKITLASNIIEEVLVDYKFLNLHRCHICNYYLILPIFVREGKRICNNCHYDVKCQPISLVATESILLANEDYPCRWNNCNEILKGNLIGDHEMECDFRIYNCFCCSTAYRSSRDTFKNHVTKKFSFHTENDIKMYRQKTYTCVTFVRHEFVKYEICFGTDTFIVSYVTTSKNKKKIKFTIKFKHQHCKAESNDFVIDPDDTTTIVLHQLPDCFWSDNEILAQLTIS